MMNHRLMLVTGLAAAVPVIASTARGAAEGWTPYFDRAYIAASSYDVLTLHPPLIGRWTQASVLTGHATYSLGPLLYWLLALPAHVRSPISLEVWMGSVNAAAVIGVVGLAYRRGGRPLMFATAGALTVMCGSLPSESLHDPQDYYAYLLPFTLLLFLCWSVACGDYKLLPLNIIVASFVIQCHPAVLGPAVGVLGLGLVGLGDLTTRVRATGNTWRAGAGPRWALAALGVGLVCWSGPLIDQAIHRPGNLVLLTRLAFSRGRTDGLTVGWHALVRAIGIPPWWLRAPVSQPHLITEININRPGALAVAFAVLILAGLVTCVVLGIRRRRGDVAVAASSASCSARRWCWIPRRLRRRTFWGSPCRTHFCGHHPPACGFG